MRRTLRQIRSDLRIARPGIIIAALLMLALATGLSSYVAQDTIYTQLEVANQSVKQQLWKRAACGEQTAMCQRMARDDALTFQTDQQQAGSDVGSLQTLSGSTRHATRIMGTGIGLAFILTCGLLLINRDVRRGTQSLVLQTGGGRTRTFLRRLAVLYMLYIAGIGAALIGSLAAALAGRHVAPLPGVAVDPSGPLLASALAGFLAASVVASAMWVEPRALRATAYAAAALILLIASTALGAVGPGSWIMSGLDLTHRYQAEIGYIWVWPAVHYPQDARTPFYEIDAISSGASIGLVALLSLLSLPLILLALRRHSQRAI